MAAPNANPTAYLLQDVRVFQRVRRRCSRNRRVERSRDAAMWRVNSGPRECAIRKVGGGTRQAELDASPVAGAPCTFRIVVRRSAKAHRVIDEMAKLFDSADLLRALENFIAPPR
jgi:hypothetical protein